MTTVTAIKPSLGDLVEKFITRYMEGHFVEGVCEWNGDDALMSPRSFAHAFKKEWEKWNYKHQQYKGYADDLEEWCEIYLGNLEAKFA